MLEVLESLVTAKVCDSAADSVVLTAVMLLLATEAQRQSNLAFFSKPDVQWQASVKVRRGAEDRRISEDRECKPQPEFLDTSGVSVSTITLSSFLAASCFKLMQ